MRIRIRRFRRGEIDGVPLENFQVGLVYEVPSSVATYLITMGCAEFVLESASGFRPHDPIAVANDKD